MSASASGILEEVKFHKALAAKPRIQILNMLTLRGGIDLDTLSKKIGLKTITIRHHIKALENAGLVESSEVGGASVGRPKQTYRLAERYVNLTFPRRQYELLARYLLEDKVKGDGTEGAIFTLRSIGENVAKRMLAKLGNLHHIEKWNMENFTRYVVPELDLLGVRPAVSKSDKGLMIKTANCIFFELSKIYPDVLCEGHKAFLQTFAQAIGDYDVEWKACMVRGDDYCVWQLNRRLG